WLAPLRELLPEAVVRTANFSSGFVRRLQMTPALFQRHGEEVFRREPVVGMHFSLGRGGDRLAEARQLAACPALRHLTGLELGCNWGLTGDALAPLLASPHLIGLRALDLAATMLDDKGVQIVCASPAVARLVHLSLNQNNLHDPAAHALARAP